MIKEGGEWKTVDWQTALEFVARGLDATSSRSTAAARSARSCRRMRRSRRWRSPRGSCAALGSDNVDFRLRQTRFPRRRRSARAFRGSACRSRSSTRSIACSSIGSFLRKDHPLVAQRLRQAAKKGAQVSIAALGRRRLADAASRTRRSSPPSLLPRALAEIVVAAAQGAGKPVPDALAGHRAVAAAQGDRREPAVRRQQGAILLGNFAEQHPEASQLHALAQALAEHRRRDARRA